MQSGTTSSGKSILIQLLKDLIEEQCELWQRGGKEAKVSRIYLFICLSCIPIYF